MAASFIKLGMIDVIEWFRASVILGGDGRNGVGDLGLETLGRAKSWSRVDFKILDGDTYERFERSV